MLAPALRVREPTFRESIATYVRGKCRRFRVRRANVEDLVQEALTEIVASIASFRQEKGDFDKWGRGVALNVIRRHRRDAKRYAARFSEYHPNVDEHPAPAPSPERCVQRKQARCRLSSAANGLTAQQAEVLLLHAVDDMSHKDIATELATTEGASQKCYQRARNYMAQCIAGEVLSVMPPLDTSCNDASPPHHAASQWVDYGKWSHYSGQVAAAVVAFLLFLPTNQPEQSHASMTGEIRTGYARVMYQLDKLHSTSDKPAVYPNVPPGKPEPASLPSLRAVTAPTRVVDKPPPRHRPPLPSYNYTAHPAAHRPGNSR